MELRKPNSTDQCVMVGSGAAAQHDLHGAGPLGAQLATGRSVRGWRDGSESRRCGIEADAKNCELKD